LCSTHREPFEYKPGMFCVVLTSEPGFRCPRARAARITPPESKLAHSFLGWNWNSQIPEFPGTSPRGSSVFDFFSECHPFQKAMFSFFLSDVFRSIYKTTVYLKYLVRASRSLSAGPGPVLPEILAIVLRAHRCPSRHKRLRGMAAHGGGGARSEGYRYRV
jgi:hypothetical protein